MGKPGKLNLRNGIKGNFQLSIENNEAELIANELASKKKRRTLLFDERGHVSIESISNRREFFLGKSVNKIRKILSKYGYKTIIRPSNRVESKAMIIVVLNPSKERNISQIQVSKFSIRHGKIQYVKISTKDLGKIKIINSKKEKYKTDGNERAILLFRRYF